ncbi:MAG: DUF2461 domain-containing protein [Flavobacteriales bacterium]
MTKKTTDGQVGTQRIALATMAFLHDLERNNDRDWFEANKERYRNAHANMAAFADALIARMNTHDRLSTESGKASLMRIYNDQRFQKDRPPYAPRFGGRLGRLKPALRGGYFFRVQPGGRSHVTCGFMGPEPDDLKLIRQDIAYDHEPWHKLLRGKNLRSHLGVLFGEELASAPRGFAKDHPAIDLLRKKQFLLRRTFTDKEVLAPGFMDEVMKTYRAVRPWFDHMSEVLTSDANGR